MNRSQGFEDSERHLQTSRKPGVSILLEEASELTAEACAKYIRAQ
jgi:hypothetical protein